MDSRDDSFLDDLADELVWGRLLAVDPALPECLGGTVILLSKKRTWCVKWGMPSRTSTASLWATTQNKGSKAFPSSKVYIIIIMGHL